MGGVTSPGAEEPLARLFARAYRYLVEQLHERLRHRGWDDVRPAYGFALLAAREGTTVTALAELMGTTKQAASKLVAAMVEARYLEQGAASPDGRRRPVRLTARGRRLLATVEEIYAELEAEWADEIGATAVERMRRDLGAAVAASHHGTLPPVRPTW